ncbi:uncharacterized protein LOC122831844 isoform X2 [Gambusia affinis]|uniref:uncharacterized protein LOC122831844 isoform X2 n=1 Tax=Gambusia affinis TaxID=33528 RepID=UPI001CDCEF0F|nr:uncharacterized protein LOC122831844 isoform X2 [Gambusia affinis]
MKNSRDNDSNSTHNDSREAQERSELSNSRLFLGCLWISSILVAGSIIYMNVDMSEQQGSFKDLTTGKKQLIDERKMVKLSREREELIREREELIRKREEVTRKREEVTRKREKLSQKREELNQERKELDQKREELNRERKKLTQKREELNQEREQLTQKKEEVTREAEELKWVLGYFQKFDIFPINDYCPAKKCGPCLHDWIFFQKKCYLFYDKPAPWKTWEQSRRFCQDRQADLVVIGDLEEQEFVSRHVKSYFDIQLGYWLGLQQTNNTWTWVDGRVDTLGFWMKEKLRTPGPKARLMPGRNPSESWNKADNFFQNKFICEHEASLRMGSSEDDDSYSTLKHMGIKMTGQQKSVNDLTTEKKKLVKERTMIKIRKLDQMSQEGEEMFRNKEELDRVRAEMSQAMEDIGHLSAEKDNFLLKRDKLSQLRAERTKVSQVKDELSQEKHRLIQERDELTRQIKKLSQEREELKETLEFIQKFDTFSVKDNCLNKICKPCTAEWILFKQKCYLFYDKPAPWKTWEESRTLCKRRGADLVVIDDLQEQEFVSKHIKYYHSKHHGYWIGLQQVNNTWTWVTGPVDTLGFWMKHTVTTPGPKALVIPRQNPSESWKKAKNGFLNKFICEQNAQLRSN